MSIDINFSIFPNFEKIDEVSVGYDIDCEYYVKCPLCSQDVLYLHQYTKYQAKYCCAYCYEEYMKK